MRVLVLAAAIIVLAACSTLTMPSAREVATTGRDCTTSRTAPKADRVGAVVGGVITVAGLALLAHGAARDDSHYDVHLFFYLPGAVVTAGGLAVLGVGARSARYGFSSARACDARQP